MNKDKDILICECMSTEHQMVVYYSKEDSKPLVFLHINLVKKPFLKRIIHGLKYIFGYQCRYGAFDELILDPEDAEKINKIYKYLKN